MPANNNTQRTNTSTQIRNLYSDSAYLNISFYNTNLSFRFYPLESTDNIGRNRYNMNAGQNTTVNFEGAFALYQLSKDIIDGKVQEANLVIQCAGGASLIFERKPGQNGQVETTMSISKNNVVIPFKFQTITQQVKENGQTVTKVVESGLGAFMKTVEGYLTGINADRHLDKLTEEYAKLQQQNGGGQPQQGGYRNNGGGYRRPYNNNGGGNRRPYNNGQQNNWQPPNQQNMSSYNIPN